MRVLILISGILVCGTGAFCFAFYTNTFSDVAFLVGVVMLIAGACNTISYLISGKGKRKLTETTLVEGIVTFFYGFSVLSNQVTDSTLTMFMGTWLTLCGVTRFSQSLYVSRFNQRDWSKIVPLSLVASVLGIIMMLPWIVGSVMPLMLVGGAFLTDGLSMIVYSMYMKDSGRELAEGEARAKVRADLKKEEHEAKIAERERVRNLSHTEREKEEKRRKANEKKTEKLRQKEREATRAARKEAVRPVEERTIRLEDKDVEEIRKATSEPEKVETPSSRVVFNKPEAIPSLRAQQETPEVKPVKAEEPEIKAVNLEEIELAPAPVEFEKVDLPQPEIQSESQVVNRENILKELEAMAEREKNIPAENVEYEKINLDDLVAEPIANRTDPVDSSRFTQTLNFAWVQKMEETVNKE